MPARLLIFAACLVLTIAGVVLSQTAESPDDTTEPELIEDLEEITDLTEESTPLKSMIGRLHPAAVHFPIAWLLLLIMVEGVGTVLSLESWHRAGFYLLLILTLSLLPALISGLVNADLGQPTGETLELINSHRNLNLAASVLIVTAVVLRGKRRIIGSATRRSIYLTLLLVATVAMMLAGHLGGELVHGRFFPL